MKEIKALPLENGMKEIVIDDCNTDEFMSELNAPYEKWESFKEKRDSLRSEYDGIKNPIKKFIFKRKMNKLRKEFGLRVI